MNLIQSRNWMKNKIQKKKEKIASIWKIHGSESSPKSVVNIKEGKRVTSYYVC